MSTIDIETLTDEDINALSEQGLTLPLTYHTLKYYLPHRYPFMLVDRITACKPGECITGIKNVTINEEFFNGHFPDCDDSYHGYSGVFKIYSWHVAFMV